MSMEDDRIGLSILYAVIAAIIGGTLWGIIVILLDYELGLAAWAIGGMAGYAVVLSSQEAVNQKHQVIAVLASLLGIILGKYIAFVYWMNSNFNALFSEVFDGNTFSYFTRYFTSFFNAIDIVFIGLAIVTAWQIPGKRIK